MKFQQGKNYECNHNNFSLFHWYLLHATTHTFIEVRVRSPILNGTYTIIIIIASLHIIKKKFQCIFFRLDHHHCHHHQSRERANQYLWEKETFSVIIFMSLWDCCGFNKWTVQIENDVLMLLSFSFTFMRVDCTPSPPPTHTCNFASSSSFITTYIICF